MRCCWVGGGGAPTADISWKKTGHAVVQIRLVHKLFCKFSVLGVFSTSKYSESEIDNWSSSKTAIVLYLNATLFCFRVMKFTKFYKVLAYELRLGRTARFRILSLGGRWSNTTPILTCSNASEMWFRCNWTRNMPLIFLFMPSKIYGATV